MTEEQLQKKCFKCIDNNLDSTFDKISDNLLDLWTLDEGAEPFNDDEEKCDEFTYFMYAFLKYKPRQGLASFTQDEDEMFKLFDSFQVILAVAIISRDTDVQVKLIRMFDFDNYRSMQVSL